MDKPNGVYTLIEYHLTLKRKEILTCYGMDETLKTLC